MSVAEGRASAAQINGPEAARGLDRARRRYHPHGVSGSTCSIPNLGSPGNPRAVKKPSEAKVCGSNVCYGTAGLHAGCNVATGFVLYDLLISLKDTLHQLAGLYPQLVEIVGLSLRVTLTAVAIATVIGFALGGVLAVYRFPGRNALIALTNALMGLPPVVAGLVVYLFLSTRDPSVCCSCFTRPLL